MFVVNSFVGDLFASVVLILTLVILHWKWRFQYWSRRNVPYPEPRIPYGNITEAMRGKENLSVSMEKIYEEMKKKGHKYVGVYTFTKPMFLPIDLDIIRNILSKDFHFFPGRNVYYNEKEPLQANLLNFSGQKWKNLRAKLTPTFTSGKMKMMFNIMVECQRDLLRRMDEECGKREPVDIKNILADFTTNIIGSCAFGLEFKALEDDNSGFKEIGKHLFNFPGFLLWKRYFAVTFPKLGRLFNIFINSNDVVKFVTKVVRDIVDYREKNNYTRDDFMQLLIDLKNNKPSGDHDGNCLTMDEVASQCFIFFGAGFDTSSTLMTFALYELAKNQDIQEKLRKEINSVLAKHDHQLTYDSVQDMTYLSQVIDEALRMHPPGASISRKCVQDYKIPNHDLVIEKGTVIKVSILGIHHDEEYYPNPSKFDPERFNEKNRKLRHPYAHLPFGEGPRNCIGMRFALLQSKVGLVSLIKNYKFMINRKTPEPLVYDPESIILAVKGDVWLDVEKV